VRLPPGRFTLATSLNWRRFNRLICIRSLPRPGLRTTEEDIELGTESHRGETAAAWLKER
jgi:hypothetical protein